MKRILQRTIFPLIFLVAACSSSKKEIDVCPLIVADNSVVRASYYESGNESLKTNIMDIIINDLYYSCEEDDGKLSVKIAPEFKVIKRMAYKQGESFSYFVAVADKNGGIVSKQTFKITVDKIDEIGFSIIKDNKDVSVDLGSNNKDDYVIYIGLQLNEKQLKNNRSDKLWLN